MDYITKGQIIIGIITITPVIAILIYVWLYW